MASLEQLQLQMFILRSQIHELKKELKHKKYQIGLIRRKQLRDKKRENGRCTYPGCTILVKKFRICIDHRKLISEAYRRHYRNRKANRKVHSS